MLPCLELLRPSRPLTDQSWRRSCQADQCNAAPCNHYCSSGAISEHSLHHRALLVKAVFDNGFFAGPPCVPHIIYNSFCLCKTFGGLIFSGPPCVLHIIYNNSWQCKLFGGFVFEQTSVRPAHYLQQPMRFGGPADSGLYNTK